MPGAQRSSSAQELTTAYYGLCNISWRSAQEKVTFVTFPQVREHAPQWSMHLQIALRLSADWCRECSPGIPYSQSAINMLYGMFPALVLKVIAAIGLSPQSAVWDSKKGIGFCHAPLLLKSFAFSQLPSLLPADWSTCSGVVSVNHRTPGHLCQWAKITSEIYQHRSEIEWTILHRKLLLCKCNFNHYAIN